MKIILTSIFNKISHQQHHQHTISLNNNKIIIISVLIKYTHSYWISSIETKYTITPKGVISKLNSMCYMTTIMSGVAIAMIII